MSKSIKSEFNELISTISLEIMKEKPLKSFNLAVNELLKMEEKSQDIIKDVSNNINEMQKITDKNSEKIVERMDQENVKLQESMINLNYEVVKLKKKNTVLLFMSFIQIIGLLFLVFQTLVG
jgi:hypothetical protein